MTSRLLTRWLAFLASAVALAGCVSRATVVDPNATAAQAADKAIVIISVSHDRTLRGASAHFYLDGGSPEVVQVESAADKMELPIKNHFRDKFGHVYVLEVKPGHHRFTNWMATWQNMHTTTTSGPIPLEFDVAKGDVIYLGNLHVNWLLGKTWLGGHVPYAAVTTVSDKSAEDIPIAERTNPAIAGKVRPALLPLGPWGKPPPPPPESNTEMGGTPPPQ